MITINASVVDHALSFDNDFKLPTGSVEIDQITFTFAGSDWSSASAKYAAFWQAPEAVYKVTISNNSAVIPPEVLAERGIVHVAVYGDLTGGKRISTNEVMFYAPQGALTEETAPAPTESMFEQAVDAAVQEVIDGGIIDSTLSISLKAADSKTVGDRLADAYSLVQALTPRTGTGSFTWESGSIDTSGSNISNTARARMKYRGTSARRRIIMLSDPTYELRVYVYTAETGGSFVKYMPEGRWCDASLGVLEDPGRDGGAYYRVVVKRKDNAVISTAERTTISNALTFRYVTDTTLTEAGMPADAVAVANAIDSRVTSLDEVAWGTKTFRDIFVDGDLLHRHGQFEDGNLDFWSTGGDPVLTAEGAGHVLECTTDGTSSCRAYVSNYVTFTNRPYVFAAIRAKVDSAIDPVTNGYGIIDSNYGEAPTGGLKATVMTTTNGWVTLSGRYRPSTNSSQGSLYIGNFGATNNGHAYFDNCVWINLTAVFGSTVPSEAVMTDLYNRYVDYVDRHKPGGGDGLSEAAKEALLALLQDVAYATPSAQAHYNALVSALDV